MPDCYGIDDGDKDAIEDAIEVYETGQVWNRFAFTYFGF